MQITELPIVPGMSALLGTKGDAALYEQINKKISTTYFGSDIDRFNQQHQTFVTRFIEPIRIANLAVQQTAARLNHIDTYITLQTEDDLRNIPPCMMLPILTEPKMHSLHRQGRIDGWGFNSEWLVDEVEMYTRLIDTNGVNDLTCENSLATDDVSLQWVHDVDDIVLTADERQMIEDSRRYVNRLLEETSLDPTDVDNIRG